MSIIVLPDVPLPPGPAHRLARRGDPVLFRHPSGRPWVTGAVIGRVVSVRTRALDVVILGAAVNLDKSDLARRIGNRSGVAELDDLAAELVEGGALFLARQHDRLRSQGPLFLTRSLCWTTVEGVPVVSDEQLSLRDLAGLRPDPEVLATRLTTAEITHPFGLASIWAGVHTLGPGQWLDSREGRSPSAVVWWRPPAPDQSIVTLADRLRLNVEAALRARTAAHPVVSADLSGGLDSTVLNFALADIGRASHTMFLASSDVANNDELWARRAATELGVEHRVRPYGDLLPYLLDERLGTVEACPEGPGQATAALGSVSLIENAMAGTGTTLHLNGHAGDALFGPVSTMLWSLVHSSERNRWLRARRVRVANRFALVPTVRMLTRSSTCRQDLERMARSTFDRADDGIESWSRWSPLPEVHPALTPLAHDHLRRAAAEAAASENPQLAPDLTTHQILQYLVVHGNVVRRMNQASAGRITFDSPYLDRRVVETALSLRIGQRAYQNPAKPLLAAARPAGMSLDYFHRPDKGEYSRETFNQHAALKPLVRELFSQGSALEDLGLVSGERIVGAVDAFTVSGAEHENLDNIAFAERWLRSAMSPPRTAQTAQAAHAAQTAQTAQTGGTTT